MVAPQPKQINLHQAVVLDCLYNSIIQYITLFSNNRRLYLITPFSCEIIFIYAYEEIFGDYVREYNSKQKRNDKKIKNGDYLSKIKSSKNWEFLAIKKTATSPGKTLAILMFFK